MRRPPRTFLWIAMNTPLHISRMERLAPWLAGGLFALPVVVAKYPPMADLPLHEASVALLRHWGDTRFAPPTLYFLNLGHSNQLFSLLVFAFSYVLPIAWASKTVVAASLVALPVAAGHFADHVRAPRWTALLVAPVGIGWLFFWGLVQNILGLVALLALLPSIDRFAERPKWRGALGMCGAMVLLHFAHQAMQLVACAALVLCCVGAPQERRGLSLVIRALPIVFCGALGFAANRYAWHVAGPLHIRSIPLVFHTFEHKLIGVPGVLFGGYEPYVRNLMMLLTGAPLILFAIERWRVPNERGRTIARRLHAWRFELLAALLFVMYFAAPMNIKSTTLVYHRFLPPAWAVLAVCVAANTPMARPLTRALCAVAPVASLLISWPTFVDSDRIYSDIDDLIPYVEPGSALVAFNLGPSPPHRLWSPVVALGHVMAVRGGRELFDYTQSTISPVAQRPAKQWPDAVHRLDGHPYAMRPDWDLTRFRYLFLVTPRPALAASVALALNSEARFLANKGDWYLFESRLPLVPIDADEATMPLPHPPTLLKKLEIVAADLSKQIEEAPHVAEADSPAEPVHPTTWLANADGGSTP